VNVQPGEILLYSGRYVKPLKMTVEDISIVDIAHNLSNLCRFTGATREFYSVAQHSVLVAQYLSNRGAELDIIRLGLLHDAAEAYLGDMAGPLKDEEVYGRGYRHAEQKICNLIADAFDLKLVYHPDVKEADKAIYLLERARLMPPANHEPAFDGISLPLDINFQPWPPEVARERFMEAFFDLFNKGETVDAIPADEALTDVITMEDFLAGRFDKAVPINSPEGQAIAQGRRVAAELPWEDVPSVIGYKVEEPTIEDAEWLNEARAAAEGLENLFSQPSVFERHPNSARFHGLLREIGELHDRKQADYGRGDDPFANVRASEEWNVDGWIGAMVRLNDKVRRLQSLSTKGSLANESAFDSLQDIAVYALIAYVLLEQDQAEAA
jgi:hypothetical protein